MARAGMGCDAGPDGAYSQHQHRGEISDAKEIRLSSMPVSTPLLTPKFAVNSRVELAERATKIAVDSLDFYYGRTQALENISLDIPEQAVMAFIGPSGCGKTTLLRTLNRMNDV